MPADTQGVALRVECPTAMRWVCDVVLICPDPKIIQEFQIDRTIVVSTLPWLMNFEGESDIRCAQRVRCAGLLGILTIHSNVHAFVGLRTYVSDDSVKPRQFGMVKCCV